MIPLGTRPMQSFVKGFFRTFATRQSIKLQLPTDYKNVSRKDKYVMAVEQWQNTHFPAVALLASKSFMRLGFFHYSDAIESLKKAKELDPALTSMVDRKIKEIYKKAFEYTGF